MPITRSTDLINLINRTRPNTSVPMLVQRAGQQLNITATLQAAPDDTPANDATTANPTGGPILGLRVRDLNPTEKSQLPVAGVYVEIVQPNGLAARSQMAVGDVITRLNNTNTPNVAAFAEVLKKLPVNKVVGVSLLRNGVPVILGLRIEAAEKP
jgi:serine protease Do